VQFSPRGTLEEPPLCAQDQVKGWGGMIAEGRGGAGAGMARIHDNI